jgi:hypothetical protein
VQSVEQELRVNLSGLLKIPAVPLVSWSLLKPWCAPLKSPEDLHVTERVRDKRTSAPGYGMFLIYTRRNPDGILMGRAFAGRIGINRQLIGVIAARNRP